MSETMKNYGDKTNVFRFKQTLQSSKAFNLVF